MAAKITLENVENKSDTDLFEDCSGCQLCLEKASKYTCPRCSVKYCSVECYKCEKHLKCSEEFYKNCVLQALQDDKIDRKGKERMIEILKRQQQNEAEEAEMETDDLEERLEGLDLEQDSEKIWSKLTEVEKQEFEKAVDTGYIGSLLDPWVPWWIIKDQSSSNIISSEISTDQETSTLMPKIVKSIPSLQDILKSKEPSQCSRYNLINILYSYAYICRFYNGCHLDFLQEAVEGLWKISAVLYHTVNFNSVDSTIRSCIESSLQHNKFHSSVEFSVSVIKDVSLLLKGQVSDAGRKKEHHFVELALSGMYKLFSKSVNLYRSQTTKEEYTDIIKPLWLAKKKVYFMLAWFHENKDECTDLEPFLPIVAEAVSLEFRQHNQEKEIIEQSRLCGSLKRRKLIEEI